LDHPLVQKEQSNLRRRVIHFLKNGFSVPRQSNIIFLCGGNDDHHMRPKFRDWCKDNLDDHIVFLPEYAIDYFFEDQDGEAFNLADFERLIAEISKVIVIFPEAPGSYAETGYFSARKDLAKMSILAMDEDFVGNDSFLSMGPAREIEKETKFHPVLQFKYRDPDPDFQPDFTPIADIIKRYKMKEKLKSLDISKFNSINSLDLMIFINCVVEILTIATLEDLFFILRGCFGPNISTDKVKKLVSILIGAKFFKEIGEYGHMTAINTHRPLAKIKEGYKNIADEIGMTLADIYQGCDDDFLKIVEGARNAS